MRICRLGKTALIYDPNRIDTAITQRPRYDGTRRQKETSLSETTAIAFDVPTKKEVFRMLILAAARAHTNHLRDFEIFLQGLTNAAEMKGHE